MFSSRAKGLNIELNVAKIRPYTKLKNAHISEFKVTKEKLLEHS